MSKNKLSVSSHETVIGLLVLTSSFPGGDASSASDPSSPSGAPSSSPSVSDALVGSTVDVGGTSVRVCARIGEGGFAFVYSVAAAADPSRRMALKRLLAVDQVGEPVIVIATSSKA